MILCPTCVSISGVDAPCQTLTLHSHLAGDATDVLVAKGCTHGHGNLLNLGSEIIRHDVCSPLSCGDRRDKDRLKSQA